MNWLQKTNHVLFLLLAIIGLLIGTVVLTDWATDAYHRWFDSPRDEVVSTDRAEELSEQNKRVNLVSTSHAELIDSSRSLYLVPISQKRLREPETLQRAETFDSHLTQRARRGAPSHSYRVAQGSGSFNNLVLYNASTSETTQLFDGRVGVTEYLVINDPVSRSLFVLLASSDTNNDGVLRPDDRRSLIEYQLDTRSRRALTDSSRHVLDLRYVDRGQTLFVTTGIDRDGNGTFDPRTEPKRLYRVERDRGTLAPVVPNRVRQRLQSILDARPQRPAFEANEH